MSDLKRDWKGVWIPKNIWLDKDLSMTEKCLLIEIDSLNVDNKGCFASDLYLANFIQKSEKTVSNLLTELRKRGYVKSEYDGLKRRLKIVFKSQNTTSRKQEVPLPENGKTTSRKREYSNTVSIYINNTIAKLQNNQMLLEVIAMQNKQLIEVIKSKIEEFVKHSFSTSGEVSDKDLFLHFGNWIRKQNFDLDKNVDVELNWFIKTFNTRCSGQFLGTEKIRELFTIQLNNGFTGSQMFVAIDNLFSSSDKNKFHKETSFKFATPAYLLKDENLNKYLNQRF